MDQEQVGRLLDVLETMIGKRQGFPIPLMGPRQRKAHIVGIRAKVHPIVG